MLMFVSDILKVDCKERFRIQPSAYCCDCKKALRDSITGCRKTKEGPMCNDCYFGALSKHIDNHPIMFPPPGCE